MNFLLDDLIRFFIMAVKLNIFVVRWVFRSIAFIFTAGRVVTRMAKGQPGWTLSLATRFEHMHVVAGSGHGKTQMLQHSISNDMSLLIDKTASVIVIDSQGDMIRKILATKAAASLSGSTVLLSSTPQT